MGLPALLVITGFLYVANRGTKGHTVFVPNGQECDFVIKFDE